MSQVSQQGDNHEVAYKTAYRVTIDRHAMRKKQWKYEMSMFSRDT